MTKDKERDDALIAEVVETLRDVRDGVGCQPGYINTLGLRRIDAMLAKLQPAPKPDRAEVLAQALWDQWTLKASEVIDAQSLINDAFNELRAEWEAERPAVVVPSEAVTWARKYLADSDKPLPRYVGIDKEYRTVASFILSLDGAKGGA